MEKPLEEEAAEALLKMASRLFHESGISGSLQVVEAGVLMVLREEGQLPVGVVQKKVNVRLPPQMTRVLKRLEGQEFVSRRIDPKDHRRKLLYITEKGIRQVEEDIRDRMEDILQCFERLPKDRIRSLLGTLNLLSRWLDGNRSLLGRPVVDEDEGDSDDDD